MSAKKIPTQKIRRLMQPLYIVRSIIHKRLIKDIVSIVLLVLSLFLLLDSFASDNTEATAETSSFPGWKPVVVMSASMEPALLTHAAAIVRKTDRIKEGDIVMYARDGLYIVHRCIGKTDDGRLITKGDNNPDPDPLPVSINQVYGKVVLRLNILAGLQKHLAGNFAPRWNPFAGNPAMHRKLLSGNLVYCIDAESGSEDAHSTYFLNGSNETACSAIHLYPRPMAENPVITEGEWVLADEKTHRWNYRVGSDIVKNGWILAANPWSPGCSGCPQWYYFYPDGQMAWGWMKASELEWYFLHEVSDGNLGSLMTGWHEDREDGFTYYLDPHTGKMLYGWQKIDNEEYYFAELSTIAGQNWFFRGIDQLERAPIFQWFFRNFHRRTFGSMYRSERTPDGGLVDSMGRKITTNKGTGAAGSSGRKRRTAISGEIRLVPEGNPPASGVSHSDGMASGGTLSGSTSSDSISSNGAYSDKTKNGGFQNLLPRSVIRQSAALYSGSNVNTIGYIRLEIPVIRAALNTMPDDRGKSGIEKSGTGADGLADKGVSVPLRNGSEISLVDALIPSVHTANFKLIAAAKGQREGGRSVYLYRCLKTLRPDTATPSLYDDLIVPDFASTKGISDAYLVSGYLIQKSGITVKAADKEAIAWAGLS